VAHGLAQPGIGRATALGDTRTQGDAALGFEMAR
jgi:hypothetical protein